MIATSQGGQLQPIPNCQITIGQTVIALNILPEITDSKSAHYNDEPVIGRSFPIKTFAYGDNRTITMKLHFVTLSSQDANQNLTYLRALQSLTYPQSQSMAQPYLPPPIAQIQCGQLFTSVNSGALCAVLDQYSVSFPTDVAWTDNLIPYKFDVDLTWKVVFGSTNLPGSEMIMSDTPS